MNELRQCEEAFLDPDWPREYRVPEMSEEVYEDLRREREMEMAKQKIDDGGPAFPRPFSGADATVDFSGFDNAQSGMSLLDYFAGQALVGFAQHNGYVGYVQHPEHRQSILSTYAKDSYALAEALLAERKRRMGGQ